MAKAAGLERLQVCENARPLSLGPAGWAELAGYAREIDLEIGLGSMTLDPATVREYLDRVTAIEGSMLRIVLERAGAGPLSVDRIQAFLDTIVPELESRGVRLAIENHFDIPSRLLARAVDGYPRHSVGFCVDVANSLRNFEDGDTVLDLLGDRAFCYHFKDYRIAGSNVGFSVIGAPFGEGVFHWRRAMERILGHTPDPEIYLETWTPSSGDAEADVSLDAEWLRKSIANFRGAVTDANGAHKSAAAINSVPPEPGGATPMTAKE
jgi:sugar phosphate isomerase/epimerase